MSIKLVQDKDELLEIAINIEMNKMCHAISRENAVRYNNRMTLLIAQRSPKKIKELEIPILNKQ